MRNVVRLIGIYAFLSTSLSMFGQQTTQFSQYMFNKYEVNPAYGGMDYSLSLNAAFRSQYVGVPGNPKSRYLSGHMPLYIWNGAVGFQLISESIGVEVNTGLAGSYNYVYESPYGLISAGVRLGLFNKSLDGGRITTPDGDYEGGSFNHKDPILSEQSFAGLGYNYQMGVYFKGRVIEGGISFGEIPEHSISLGLVNIEQRKFANAIVQYDYQFSDEIVFMQSILLKTDFVELQTDISSIVKLNGSIFGGIGMRGYSSTSFDAIAIIMGMKLNKKYTLTYSYDFGISNLKRVNEGSHEIILNYNLQQLIGAGLPPRIIYNPRNL